MANVHDAVIVGAGFGGMGAAIQLKRMGITDVLLLEREADLGGTWHVNRYPGLAVDIPSTTYSYSFEPNPYWSRLFAPGAELKRYAEHVADKYELRSHMRFNSVVEGAAWDEQAQHWTVEVAGAEPVHARFLITATGFLSQPRTPDIRGIETFAGKVVHTANWDESYDLRGKRVAIIGTGATGVQLIPEVAKLADDLTVYQRTPIWVAPKTDGPIPPRVQKLFARLPVAQRGARMLSNGALELLMIAVLHYRHVSFLNRHAERVAKQHLHRQVKDPELRRKLTPDYTFGCKRPTFSNSYYRAFNRDNVHLETTPIERVEPDGIVTADGNKTVIDALLLATGFDIWETNFPAIDVTGRDGRNLGEWWRKTRFQAYEGLTVPYFPNLLSLASPYSYSGLSYFTTIEAQMKHIKRLLGEMQRRGATTFEVTEQANDAFLERMLDRMGDTIFNLGSCATARSYYFNQHGEAALLRPTSTLNALAEAGRFPLEDYAFA